MAPFDITQQPTADVLGRLQQAGQNPVNINPSNFQAPVKSQTQLPANTQPAKKQNTWGDTWGSAIFNFVTYPFKLIKDSLQGLHEAAFGTPDKYEQVAKYDEPTSNAIRATLADAMQRLSSPDLTSSYFLGKGIEGLENPYRETGPLINQAYEGLQDPLQGFGPLEDAAIKSYNEKIIPGLLNRFSGATTSPYIQQNLKNSAQEFGQNLSEQRALYGLQNRDANLRQLQLGFNQANIGRNFNLGQSQVGLNNALQNREQNLNQARTGLTPLIKTHKIPGQSGFLKEIAEPAAKAAGAAALALI